MAEDLWRDVADAYERSFASLCTGTVGDVVARVPAGARVVDVGSGTGILAAALVGSGRSVTAVDPDPAMVARTRARPGVAAMVGGLPDLGFAPASFDAAVANFVLNHVDDPRTSAAGLARTLGPGGRVVATIWPAYVPPQGVLWGAVLDAAGAVRPDLPRLPEHLDFERSADGLADLLVGAGLTVVESASLAWEWRVAPEDFWVGATGVGNFAVAWRAQEEPVRERMREAYEAEQLPWRAGSDLVFPVQCALVVAERPR